MKKEMNIAVVLTAVDKMSKVVGSAVTRSQQYLSVMARNQERFGRNMQAVGMNAAAVGAATAAALKQPIDAFMEQEKASERLSSAMLKDGNRVNEYYQRVNELAIMLGNKLPGTSADLQNMMTALIRNGVAPEQILGGMGEATANLAVVLEKSYDETAVFSSKLGKAAGIASQDMMKFLDIISRTATLGVQTEEMQYAFSKSSSALQAMKLTGLEASKSVSALYASLIQAGASGETVGTGMTSLFNAAVNPEKMAKFNAELAKLGMAPMKFTDAKGNFMGIENMIAQLDRIKAAGLGSEQTTTLTNALLGPGQDANFLGQIIANGMDGYNGMVKSMSNQAQMTDKVNRQLGTLASRWDAATGTFTNMLAKFGKSMEPTLKAIADGIGQWSEKLMVLMDKYPTLTKIVGGSMLTFAAFTFAIGGTALAIGSVARVISIYASSVQTIGKLFGAEGYIMKAIRMGGTIFRGLGQAVMWVGRAFMIAGRFMMANPIILIIAAIATAAFLIYKYWDDIVPFFKNLWAQVSAWFTKAWAYMTAVIAGVWRRILGIIKLALNTVWDLFTSYHPIGIVIKHWNEILAFMKGLPTMFFNAGANIMKSIWEGMKSMADKPIEAIKETVDKMRQYLPFSPAKVGPLKDIHRVKIVETIAGAVKPAPLVRAMRTVAVAGVAAAAPVLSPAVAAPGLRPATAPVSAPSAARATQQQQQPVNIVYSPTINITGGTQADKDEFARMLREHSREIIRIQEENNRRNQTKSFK